MGRKKPSTRDEEGAGGGKSKKKNYVIDDDEYAVGSEVSEEPVVQEERPVPVPGGGKKKGKKGKKAALKDEDEDDDIVLKDVEDEEDEVPAQFGGKNKSKGKKNGGNSGFSAFGLLGEDEDNEDDGSLGLENNGSEDNEADDEDVPAIIGTKNSSKLKKGGGKSLFSSSAFDAIEDEDVDDKDSLIDDSVTGQQSDEEDEPVIAFSGKKKKSKSSKKVGNMFSAAILDGLDEEGGGKNDDDEEVEEDVTSVIFTGKKKKSSKSSKKNPALLLDEVNDDETPALKSGNQVLPTEKLSHVEEAGFSDEDAEITFSGKKKSSKKKSSSALEAGNSEESADSSLATSGKVADDLTNKNPSNVDAVGISKNKKKKKKSERTAQEEDELDKILAELGGGPSEQKAAPSTAAAPEEKLETEPEGGPAEKGAEEDGPVESAAAKKKKKKKEKEKEKKAAAAVAVEEKQEELKKETKGKVADKKVPKHVREMQERLAKLKEAEEKQKREEEEKLRKEEEERRRQEEQERLAEEKKRLKKEREKEKLLKKKQEGKLLTGKQKEEARRLEAMRKQILANAGGLPSITDDTGVTVVKKKPIYKTKKSRPQTQVNGAIPAEVVETPESQGTPNETLSGMDTKEMEKVEDEPEEVKPPVSNITENREEEEEEEEDEDWDAKSWDEADLKLPGKSAFSDEEVDSEPELLKSTQPMSHETSSLPQKSLNGEGKQRDSDTDLIDKSKKKELVGKKEKAESSAGPTESNLRSPICCIMGHVDTGKTKLLDCIRGTNVQEGEAGGITQQIGATYFPAENIRERTKELKADAKLNVPGLLVIDTPGHESFTNLRSRGSGLCDIAILVVDIMHGLEPQTIESLNLLKMRNTEFVVALNKVDRLYGWKTCRNAPIVKAIKQQSKDVQNEFNMRLTQIVTQFKEQGLNTELYYKNKEMGETFSIVPTSAISGEGIPDMLLLLVQWTQKTMIEKLTFSNEIQCTVLEVKVVEGHGTTIDVVLVNGVLHEGDQIVVCGMQEPIVTTIRALLTPHPMKELRVKGTYVHHKEIKAAQGIKITAQGLEHAIAGTSLYVVGPNDDLEDIMESAMDDMRSVMNRIDKTGEGVCVQASTLGSLEALLEFLKSDAVKIPVSGISIGPVHKKDVMKASVMLEKRKEYATILAFDVKVTPDARELADDLGVRIFCADIIYHLFDQFKAYIDNLKEERKRESAEEAVFPCVLKIMPGCIFNKKDPIVLGVDVLEGIAKIGTPICVPQKEFIEIGRIASIENNHKAVDYAKKGQTVAIKIVGSNSEEQQKMYGRHFEQEDELVSRISRRSIDILKENYRNDLSMEEWKLVAKLKTLFKIQ